MAYEKTIWTAGDVITSEKLNHLEGGVEAASQLAPATVTIPVYYSVDYATPVLLGTIANTPGDAVSELLLLPVTIPGDVSSICADFSNSEWSSSESFYGMVEYISKQPNGIRITCYMPANIPDNCDRILVHVYT